MRRIMLWTAPERPRTLRFCLVSFLTSTMRLCLSFFLQAYFVLWGLGLLIPGLVSFIVSFTLASLE